jgi:hypothetical protein
MRGVPRVLPAGFQFFVNLARGLLERKTGFSSGPSALVCLSVSANFQPIIQPIARWRMVPEDGSLLRQGNCLMSLIHLKSMEWRGKLRNEFWRPVTPPERIQS